MKPTILLGFSLPRDISQAKELQSPAVSELYTLSSQNGNKEATVNDTCETLSNHMLILNI
jgi:hypothetical protein